MGASSSQPKRDSQTLRNAYADAKKKGQEKDASTQHKFNYQSKIECPVVALRDAHKNYMEAMMCTRSYAIYNQAAHDREREAENVINRHPQCAEYWAWFNDAKTNVRIKREMFPNDYAHLPQDL